MKSIYTQTLPNFKYLDANDFPSTTSLYAWHLNGTSSFSGVNWNGGIDLTAISTITSRSNHLGETTYCDFDGTSDAAYINSTSFDTANESFTVGGWVRFDNQVSTTYFMTKATGTSAPANHSFLIQRTSSYIGIDLYYNNTDGIVSLKVNDELVSDGLWHHIVSVYDQANTKLSFYIDGKLVSTTVNDKLATRNNTANAKVTFGSYGNGTAEGGRIDGGMSDLFYCKYAMSFDQVRKIYATGSRSIATLNGRNEIDILGEARNGRDGQTSPMISTEALTANRTLVYTNERVQNISASGTARIIFLPSTNISAGEEWTFIGSGATESLYFYIESSNGDLIRYFYNGTIKLMALINNPTTSSHWVVTHEDNWVTITDSGFFTYTNISSVTAIRLDLRRSNRICSAGLYLVATGAAGPGVITCSSVSVCNTFFPANEVTGTMYLTTNLSTALGTFIVSTPGTKTITLYGAQNFQNLAAGALRVGHPSSAYGAILGSWHK